MPAIWTFGPENATGIDLSTNAFWRVTLGGVYKYDMSWLALVAIYPPAPGQTVQQTQIVLARTGIPVASRIEDVLKLAEVSVSTGTLDGDTLRMTEAFNMFKNNPRTKQEILESSTRDGLEVLTAYWTVRDWLMSGAKEGKDVQLGSFTIKLRP